MSTFRFVDELPEDTFPPRREHRAVLKRFASALKERPLTWAVYPVPVANPSLVATHIRAGRYLTFGENFDTAVRNGVLYVQYDSEAI
jgi:hypothetical protein